MAEETLSIDQCPDCGGWLGVQGDAVFEGSLVTCTDCEAEWEAGVFGGGTLVWIAPTPPTEREE